MNELVGISRLFPRTPSINEEDILYFYFSFLGKIARSVSVNSPFLFLVLRIIF